MTNQKWRYFRIIFFAILSLLLILLAVSRTHFILTTDHSEFDCPGFLRQAFQAGAEAVLFLAGTLLSIRKRFTKAVFVITAALLLALEGIFHLIIYGISSYAVIYGFLAASMAGAVFLILFYYLRRGRIFFLVLAAPVWLLTFYENYYNLQEYMSGIIGGATVLDIIEEAGSSALKLVFLAWLLVSILLNIKRSPKNRQRESVCFDNTGNVSSEDNRDGLWTAGEKRLFRTSLIVFALVFLPVAVCWFIAHRSDLTGGQPDNYDWTSEDTAGADTAWKYCYKEKADTCSVIGWQWDGDPDNMTIRVPDEIDGRTVTSLSSNDWTIGPFEVYLPEDIQLDGENVFLTEDEACVEPDDDYVTYHFTIIVGPSVEDMFIRDTWTGILDENGESDDVAYKIEYEIVHEE